MPQTVASGHEFLEAPRPEGEGVWFSDLVGGVWRVDPDGERLVVPKRRSVGGIALHAQGGVVITGRTICHVGDEGSRDLYAADGVVFNDLCTDQRGRLWAGGSWDANSAEAPGRRAGAIYRIDAPGHATIVVAGLGIPNGMGFAPDGSTLYVVDSSTRQVLSGAVVDDEIGPLDVVIDLSQDSPPDFGFPPAMPTPDGLAVDEEGGIWVAILGSGTVVRFAPDGSIDTTVEVPHRLVTSVAFGGADRRELFITTGRPGALFRTGSPVAGLRCPPATI